MTSVTKALAGMLLLITAMLTVGLTASSDGPFSINIEPVFLRLGVDVDIKIGSLHLHASWSALPSESTQSPEATF
jgi:hypothetical protein